MAHTVSWKPEYLYRKFSGEVTGEEFLKSNFDIQVHPRFAKIKYLINDFNEVTSILIDTEHTRIFASTDDIISDTKGKLKIAIVTNNDALIELAEMYRTSMKNKLFEVEIFASVAEAKKWGEQ
jgi:hypothetical protein